MDPLDLLVHGGWKCKKSCLISSRPDGLIFDLGALSHILGPHIGHYTCTDEDRICWVLEPCVLLFEMPLIPYFHLNHVVVINESACK